MSLAFDSFDELEPADSESDMFSKASSSNLRFLDEVFLGEAAEAFSVPSASPKFMFIEPRSSEPFELFRLMVESFRSFRFRLTWLRVEWSRSGAENWSSRSGCDWLVDDDDVLVAGAADVVVVATDSN